MIGLVLLVVLALFAMIGLATGGGFLLASFQDGDKGQGKAASMLVVIGIVILVSLVIGFAIEVWLFLVMHCCYRYFNDKKAQGLLPHPIQTIAALKLTTLGLLLQLMQPMGN